MGHLDFCATLRKDTKNENFRVIHTTYIPYLHLNYSDFKPQCYNFGLWEDA